MQHLTISETLSLLRMGHSEQEIMEYINEAPAPAAQPEPQPVAQPQQAAKPAAPGTELDRLYAKLAELTNAIQAGNRAAVDMSANIIDPMQAGRDALAAMGNMKKEEQK